MRLDSDDILSMLKAHWPEWTSAAAFDELIANADRNTGNLLIGAPDDVWLIDHTHAITGESWTSAGLEAAKKLVHLHRRLSSAGLT